MSFVFGRSSLVAAGRASQRASQIPKQPTPGSSATRWMNGSVSIGRIAMPIASSVAASPASTHASARLSPMLRASP
jgi:hypothetical protein